MYVYFDSLKLLINQAPYLQSHQFFESQNHPYLSSYCHFPTRFRQLGLKTVKTREEGDLSVGLSSDSRKILKLTKTVQLKCLTNN
jgi:hypothetical protein